MFNRQSMAAAAVAAVGLVTVAPMSKASQPIDHMTRLTFSRAVGLPGVTLNAGTYMFQIADPTQSADIVRVWKGDFSRVLYTGFTHRVYRPENHSTERLIVFGEAPRGTARPIMAWYPTGETIGHEFLYRR